MKINGIQRLSGFNILSFKEALKIAKDRGGELCVIVRPKKKLVDNRVNVHAQFWVLNKGGGSRSFYNKHHNKKGSLLCIVPYWFLDYLLGIYH